jgi:ribosomal protein S12 methylthiotransferase accessory factor
MEMIIDFPGGAKVDAHFGAFTVKADQPSIGGGEGSDPAPFEIFLSTIGACAGIYVLGICRQRNLPTEAIKVVIELE